MLGFIQGLLLIIIEVSIYFFYAQTFCEAGDKITVRRTIATVVAAAALPGYRPPVPPPLSAR